MATAAKSVMIEIFKFLFVNLTFGSISPLKGFFDLVKGNPSPFNLSN